MSKFPGFELTALPFSGWRRSSCSIVSQCALLHHLHLVIDKFINTKMPSCPPAAPHSLWLPNANFSPVQIKLLAAIVVQLYGRAEPKPSVDAHSHNVRCKQLLINVMEIIRIDVLLLLSQLLCPTAQPRLPTQPTACNNGCCSSSVHRNFIELHASITRSAIDNSCRNLCLGYRANLFGVRVLLLLQIVAVWRIAF